MVHQHHERLDGSGYPAGLTGEEINPGAKIIAVADVLEAMTSHRPYRPGHPLDDTLSHLQDGRGRLYDPQVVDAVVHLVRSDKLQLQRKPNDWAV